MTLPYERKRSIQQTRQFLLDVAYNYKRIPSEVKELAKSCLRHFPNDYDLEEISKKCPNLFSMNDIKELK